MSIDVSAIRVGDEVAVRGVVIHISSDKESSFHVLFKRSEHRAYIDEYDIVSHTPKPFALPDDVASRFTALSDDDKRKVLALLEGKK